MGPTITIDTLVSTNRNTDSYASAALAADGTAVVAWTVQSGDYFDNYIVARRIAADGTALTPDILVDNTPGTFSNEGAPVVVSDPAGNFVVAWNGFGANLAAAYRLFAADGTPRTDAACVAADCSAFGGTGVLGVSMDNAGDFGIVAVTSASPYFYLFHPDGTVAAAQPVALAANNAAESMSVSLNRQNGNAAITWVQRKLVSSNFFHTSYNYQAYLQRYAADGSVAGTPDKLANCTQTIYISNKVVGCNISAAAVAKDDADNTVASWWQTAYPKGTRTDYIYMHSYDSSGATVKGRTLISPAPTTAASVAGGVSIVSTAPSTFVAAWDNIDTTDPVNTIYSSVAQTIGLDAKPIGPETEVDSGTFGAAVSANSAGNVLAVWAPYADDWINSSVMGQFYQQQ